MNTGVGQGQAPAIDYAELAKQMLANLPDAKADAPINYAELAKQTYANVASAKPAPSVSVGPTFSLDGVLPQFDFAKVAEDALKLPSVDILIAGGITIAIGGFYQLWKQHRSETKDYLQPFLYTGFWALVFGSYVAIATGLIWLVTSLGESLHTGNAVAEVFSRRYHAFEQYAFAHEGHMPFIFTTDGFVTSFMALLTHISYVAVLCIVFALKAVQLFLLGTIVTWGPLLLGSAALGPFFHVLAVAWFWSLVEVCGWSVTMAFLLRMLDKFSLDVPNTYNSVGEIAVCFVIVVLMVSVPKVTSTLIRGESAGNLGMNTWRMGRDLASMAGNVAQAKAKLFTDSIKAGLKAPAVLGATVGSGGGIGGGGGGGSRGGARGGDGNTSSANHAATQASKAAQRNKAKQNFAIKKKMQDKASKGAS
jgi:uncharacterized membrane protein YgcG